MLMDDFDPLNRRMLQVLDQTEGGKPVTDVRQISHEPCTLVLARQIDDKAVILQRRGGGAYPPNRGQEATSSAAWPSGRTLKTSGPSGAGRAPGRGWTR